MLDVQARDDGQSEGGKFYSCPRFQPAVVKAQFKRLRLVRGSMMTRPAVRKVDRCETLGVKGYGRRKECQVAEEGDE
jgi:hypothetical protein